MKAKQETRVQVMKRLDSIISSQAKGHLVCRTCGEAGCSLLAHDNLLPQKSGDKFVKDGKTSAV
jgi:hypothetical protein